MMINLGMHYTSGGIINDEYELCIIYFSEKKEVHKKYMSWKIMPERYLY